MGRQQYLERLALGRSPFQWHPPTSQSEGNDDQSAAPAAAADGDHSNRQTYDGKGRPTNERTEERNASMRNAQNAVLALVGVVESNDASDRIDEARNRTARRQWGQLLQNEQERGDDLSMVVEYAHRLLTWWPEALMARIQAGVYPSSNSFTSILLHEVRRRKVLSAGVAFVVFLPGVLPHALCTAADAILCAGLVEGIGRAQIYLGRSTKYRRTPKWLRVIAMVFSELLCAGVGMMLVPLEYHAETQRLGLAPAWPLLPHWRSLVPSNPSSSHNFLWTSPTGLSRFSLIGSPGFWLVLQRTFTRYQDEETPIAGQLTTWEYPSVDKSPDFMTSPDPRHDPIAWVLYQGFLLRGKALRWLGWRLEQQTPYPDNPYQNNTERRRASYFGGHARRNDGNESRAFPAFRPLEKYRSTTLSMQMAKYIGERMDQVFQKMLMLPLESMALRVITQSFLATTLPKTSLALTAAHVAYTPFGGGPFGSVIKHGSDALTWKAAGGYLSKIGLSFALLCSTEVVISFLIYKAYRSQGTRNFDWRKPEDDTIAIAPTEGNGVV